jgi:hypothetical protein
MNSYQTIMKNILYLTDSMHISESAVDYVANLARDTSSTIVLTTIHQSKRKVAVVGESLEDDDSFTHLNKLRYLFTRVHRVPCEVGYEDVSSSDYASLGQVADKYDLLVYGTALKSSNTEMKNLDVVKLIKGVLVPLLLVPEGSEYKKINRLLYGFDCLHVTEPPLLQLHWLSDWFDADVHFISILSSPSSTQQEDKINSIHNKIALHWRRNKRVSFETIQYDNVSTCLEHYLDVWKRNDLLVLSVNHDRTLKRMMQPSIIKKLVAHAGHPLLVIHR